MNKSIVLQNYSKKRILSILLIIGLISLGLKLYTTDFSMTPPEDTYGYILQGFSHINGDFSEPERKTLGWSLIIFPFLQIIDSDNLIDFINVARFLSLSISIFSIYPMYLLGRKFFDEKYSLVCAALFAFIPQLNYISTQGLSEPVYILFLILALNFVLSKNKKLIYFAFPISGILWVLRWPGIIVFVIITILYFINNKKTSRNLLKYAFCCMIFLLMVSPMLLTRNDQFGDPLYFSQTPQLFTGEYSRLQAENTKNIEYSISDYISDNGVIGFLDKFLLGGISNIIEQAWKISFPYMMVLLPLGIFFSFRAFDQNTKFIHSTWVLILITLGSMIIYFAVVPEKRLLFPVLPFFVIISTIPIQRLINYGFSTFSFSKKAKNISLVILLSIVILLSVFFTMRYDQPDQIMENEKIIYGKLLQEKYKGRILDAGNSLQGLLYANISSNSKIFKDYKLSDPPSYDLEQINIHGNNLVDFIKQSEKEQLKFISVSKDNVTTVWYPFLNDVYENEENYIFLKKVFDSDDIKFKKFNVKLFEIDYKIFYNSLET